MRKMLLFSTIMLAITLVYGQDDDVEYIIPKKDYSFAMYLSSGVNIGDFQGEPEFSYRYSSGLIVNRTFFLGAYFSRFITKHNHEAVYNGYFYADNQTRSKFGYGGILLKYLFKPKKPVHFGISSSIGPGVISVVSPYGYVVISDLIGTVSPQVDLEMNLKPWLKLNFAAGYRYVFDVTKQPFDSNGDGFNDKRYFEKNDFNTPYGSLSLVFILSKKDQKKQK